MPPQDAFQQQGQGQGESNQNVYQEDNPFSPLASLPQPTGLRPDTPYQGRNRSASVASQPGSRASSTAGQARSRRGSTTSPRGAVVNSPTARKMSGEKREGDKKRTSDGGGWLEKFGHGKNPAGSPSSTIAAGVRANRPISDRTAEKKQQPHTREEKSFLAIVVSSFMPSAVSTPQTNNGKKKSIINSIRLCLLSSSRTCAVKSMCWAARRCVGLPEDIALLSLASCMFVVEWGGGKCVRRGGDGLPGVVYMW